MTNDDLRALADEMQSNIDEARIILRGDITVEDKAWFAMHDKAIAYLRACADAQPVAWMRPDNRVREESFAGTQFSRGEQRPPIGTWNALYTHPAPAVPAGYGLVPVRPSEKLWYAAEAAFNRAGIGNIRNATDTHGIWRDQISAAFKVFAAAAPAAAQAEPIADSDADYWLRNRRPILDAIERAGFMLMSNASGFWLHPRGTTDAQAEPKREPLSDERIAEIQRAAYERAAQECITTAAELRRCADGCTDGRYDWKADGALDCADAIRALGRQ